MPERKLRVFLCHASQDKPAVRELYKRLLTEGWIDPWLDEEKLLPGQDWNMEIEKAVESADTVIVCLSKNSVTKEGYIQKELRHVLGIADYKRDGTIFIVPVRLDNCLVPRRLQTWQRVEYFPENEKERAYVRLVNGLRLRTDEIRQPEKNTKVDNDQVSKSLSSDDKEGDIYTKGGHKIFVFGELEFVKIPSGAFWMGADEIKQSKPKHFLNISYDFWITRFPITNFQYSLKSIDFAFPYRQTEIPVMLEYGDVDYYVQWLNDKFSKDLPYSYHFRIPSEAEWEKAARGMDGRNYPWGDTLDTAKCYLGVTKYPPVGSYSPIGDSPFGVSDMIKEGMWEWTRTRRERGFLDIDYKYPYSFTDGRENGRSKWMMVRGGRVFDPNKSANLKYSAISARDCARTFEDVYGKSIERAGKCFVRLVVTP